MRYALNGKVALVTGGSNGIGRATCMAFARHGANVVVSDVDEKSGNETKTHIEAAGGKAIYIACDVADPGAVKHLIDHTVSTYGRLDYAFNNAGIEGDKAATADCSEDNWDRVMGINLKGVWLCMRHEIPQMLQQGGGSIVNCSSVAGLAGFRQLPAYAASKHGMIGLTKTAALEYGVKGIRVNALCPGVIQTPMIDRVTENDPAALEQFKALEPIGRLGEPEEIAESVVWLCSDKASFVTGVAFPVDGGFIAQ